MKQAIFLSSLYHTWIFDLDGTLLKHNGYKIDGVDSFLPGAEEFLSSIDEKDTIIILTSRSSSMREQTEAFLIKHNVRYDHIIFNIPYGERILINDTKPSGLKTAVSIQKPRDSSLYIDIIENDFLVEHDH